MSKQKKIIVVLLISITLLFIGCTETLSDLDASAILAPTVSNNNLTNTHENDEVFTLNIWCYQFDKNRIEEEFYKLFPKATANIISMESMNTAEIINSIANRNEATPDVVIYSMDYIGDFNIIDAFEDLSKEPYSFKSLNVAINEADLNECMSLKKDKLIALPFTQASTLTYYRADILEELGLPSDPTELGQLLSTAEGWLSVAKRLKEDDRYAMQWKDEFLKLSLNCYGIFDENMNLNIKTDAFKDSLYIANEAFNLGLLGKYDLWTEQGRSAVREGKVVMLHLNKWGEEYLKETAPETFGKWRVTKLPLNLYSSTNTNAISIVASSNYKTQAWELIKNLIISEANYYSSNLNQTSEFLGRQKANLLYKEVADKKPLIQRTMIDNIVYDIYIQAINSHTDKTLDVDSFIEGLESKILNTISYEQKILMKHIK